MSKPRIGDELLRKPPERLVNPDEPTPTPPVVGTAQALPARRCDHCGTEVATEPEHHREVDDYVMWFCSSGCAGAKQPDATGK